MDWNGSVFHGKSPFPSWILDDQGQWQAPTPKPEGEGYYWDEESVRWVLPPQAEPE